MKTKVWDQGLPRQIVVCRILLGIGIFLNYLTSDLKQSLGFSTENVPYGWGRLVGPFLLFVIISSAFPRGSKFFLRLFKIGVCGMCFFVAWSQIPDGPWLERAAIAEYLRNSPFAKIYISCHGFVPILEIIGGLSWLGQLLAPIFLWHRFLGKYLALILIILHSFLEIFMPTMFFNWVLVVALISFLPEKWLTLKYWVGQSAELKIAWRNFCFCFLTAVMVLTIFDRNIAWQFDIFRKIKSEKLEIAYEIVANPFVNIGALILFNSIWKMYSPTWRHVVWIDWYYQKGDGSVTPWPQDNFSPDYRMHRRTWSQALWTDFKEEKVFVGMLSDSREKIAFGLYLCHEISKIGIRPVSVHPEIYSFDIQGPDKEWSLKDQAFENREIGEEIRCDQKSPGV